MNKKLKILYFLICIFLSFAILILFWKNIDFKYNFTENINGFYFANNLSHHNNLIRFFTFVFFSNLVFFLLLKIIYYKNIKFSYLNTIFIKDSIKINIKLRYIAAIFIVIISLNYLSKDLIIYQLDYFHEGLTLSNALNYFSTKEVWTASYLSNSIFSDIFAAVIPWIIFDNISIGSFRIFHDFLRFLTEILIIFFIYKLSYVYSLKKNNAKIFLISLLTLAISLNRDLTESFYPFRYRDIPILILLILSIDFLKFNKNPYLNPILIGFMSFLSLFWSLDRGIYFLTALLFLIFLSVLKKRFFCIGLLIFGFSVASCFAFLFLEFSEIKSFYFNLINTIKYFDLYAGSTYPTLFDFKNEHAGRGTLNLLIIVFNGFLLILSLFKTKLGLSNNSKIYFIFFYFVSVLIYKSALGVPDSYHMKQSIFFSKILLASHIIYLFLKNKNFEKNSLLSLFPVILITIISFKSLSTLNYANIKNFKQRNLNFAKLVDSYFVEEKYINLKEFILRNYDINCIQVFSYNPIMPYLIKKKSCTKFNFLYVVSSENIQKDMMDEFIEKSPKIILLNLKYEFLSLASLEKKINKVYNYIIKNYKEDNRFNEWIILKKIN